MDKKQAMRFFVSTLLVVIVFNIPAIDGQQLVCPWCDTKMQTDLMNCVYTDLISTPQLMAMPLRAIDDIKYKLLSDSDSMFGMPYADKKRAMDDKFVEAMAGAVKQNNYQNNPQIVDVISGLAGNCYSWVTGYDKNVVINDIKRQVNENLQKSAAPQAGDPNPAPNSGMQYPANQNQQANFQSSQPQIQPSYGNDAPFNPPGSPPVSSFDYPSSGNGAPFNPPGSPPVSSFDYPSNGNGAPFNPPGSPPVSSFDYPSNGNGAPFNPPGSAPVSSFDYPLDDNGAPSNPPESPPVSSFDYPSNGKGASGPTENWPSNDYGGQGQDFSNNQAPSDDSSGTSFQNDDESQDGMNSPENAPLATTVSPIISTPSQGSKSSDSNSSDNSYSSTPSPHTDEPQKKTTEKENSDVEEPCDEKFKIALYEKLIKDDRFRLFFGKIPVSSLKPAVLDIMKHVFNKYGVQQHYTEFSTFWKFESKTLNKESKVEDWADEIAKICKIIFSRNNLLNEDCEKIGITIADYILGVLPGDPPATSTQTSSQNDGNDNTSTESNANSASDSTTNAAPANNANSGNSTNPENLSFPELHSKLANTFKNDGSSDQNSDNVPFSETLDTFEAEKNLETLHDAAESCLSPSGFDFEKFLSTMSDVTDSIQANHPNWSRDKCESEMYSGVVAVMAELIQNYASTSNNNNAQSQSSSNQQDSVGDSNNSQSSSSGAQSDVANDSDDSSYPGSGSDYNTGSAPQQDFKNYEDQPDGPVNAPPYKNQPGPSNWNTGSSGPVNSNYGGSTNGNQQNAPFQTNQPYQSNYGGQDYGPAVPQSMPQKFPSPDYSAVPPASMNTQPYSGNQPFSANQNTGFQQAQNFAPNSGFMNSPNRNFGNNQFQAQNLGNNYGLNNGQPAASPMLPNGNPQNFQPQPYQNYGSSVPGNGPVLPNGNLQPGFNSNYNSGLPNNGPNVPRW